MGVHLYRLNSWADPEGTLAYIQRSRVIKSNSRFALSPNAVYFFHVCMYMCVCVCSCGCRITPFGIRERPFACQWQVQWTLIDVGPGREGSDGKSDTIALFLSRNAFFSWWVYNTTKWERKTKEMSQFTTDLYSSYTVLSLFRWYWYYKAIFNQPMDI